MANTAWQSTRDLFFLLYSSKPGVCETSIPLEFILNLKVEFFVLRFVFQVCL